MDYFRCYSKKSIIVFFISVVCLSAAAEYRLRLDHCGRHGYPISKIGRRDHHG